MNAAKWISRSGTIKLYCIALHCIALHCIALHCIALHCIALHCIALHCIALHCIALHCIALHCIALHCIALHCIALHCIAVHCLWNRLMYSLPHRVLQGSFWSPRWAILLSMWRAQSRQTNNGWAVGDNRCELIMFSLCSLYFITKLYITKHKEK